MIEIHESGRTKQVKIWALKNELEGSIVLPVYACLHEALSECEPVQKCVLTQALYLASIEQNLTWDVDAPIEDFVRAGQPKRPVLVEPKHVKHRKMNTPEGYAALLHAVVHIEFNAINLALDAAYRFRHISREFTLDWLRVASEEALHFGLMRERLQAHGFDYGDFEAHNHLWDMAYKTAYDPLLRMALVPRVLEARGLDVTPAMRAKIEQKGDVQTCEVLDIIYRDEVGHVKVGNNWYHYLCQQRGLDALKVFQDLIRRYDLFLFRGHLNLPAREQAGFSAFELAMLQDFQAAQEQHLPQWKQALSRV